MSSPLEGAMFNISQLFLTPILLVVALMFAYAFYVLGAFVWQCLQRAGAHRRGDWAGHELLQAHTLQPGLTQDELEALALKRMETARITARVAPMLGLVATMIPMGPALVAVASGQSEGVANSLAPAFASVIVALASASITFVVYTVRRRWLMRELIVVLDAA